MILHFFTFVNNFFTTKIDKILQKSTFRTTSPTNAANKIPLVFFILTTLVYIAIVYKVVSVDPIIVDAIIPILLSTPYSFMISVPIAIDALP